MHGVKKVDVSEEEKDEKAKERIKKLHIYTKLRDVIFEKVKNECYDDEGLQATGQLLSKNPDIYTFWNYRKKALTKYLTEKNSKENTPEFDTFSASLENRFQNELELTETCLGKNPKSYGAWHHRGWVLQRMQKPDYHREIKQCEHALSLDERNFHCWDHWRIVCKLGNVSIEDQTKFSDKKVAENFSNYSAWHYRSKLLPSLFPDASGIMPICCDKLLQELSLLHNAFFTDPDDQSSWFYRNWLFKRIAKGDDDKTEITKICFDPKFSFIYLFFNKPADVQIVAERMKMSDLSWQAIDNSSCCRLWVAKGEETEFRSILKGIETCLEGVVKIVQTNEIGSLFEWSNSSYDDSNVFDSKLTDEEIRCLETDLKQMSALVEMESEKKWPLLVTVMSMKALSLEKYEREIFDGLKLLKTLDSPRKQFYDDLSSKWCLEKLLSQQTYSPPSSHLDLCDHGLTALYYMDTMMLTSITHLNISNNLLSSLSPLCYLINLQTLDASSNHLTNVNGLEKLNRLDIVNVSLNFIENTDALRSIASCYSLKELNLKSNPIANTISATELCTLLEVTSVKIDL